MRIQVVGECDGFNEDQFVQVGKLSTIFLKSRKSLNWVLEKCWKSVLKKIVSLLFTDGLKPSSRRMRPGTGGKISLDKSTQKPVSRYFLDISSQNRPCSLIENGAKNRWNFTGKLGCGNESPFSWPGFCFFLMKRGIYGL